MGLRRTGRVTVIVSALLASTVALLNVNPPRSETIELGVTYSPRYASWLGLDPHALYVAILEELHIQHVRLPLYWEDIEPEPNVFDFSEVDFYLAEAEARGVSMLVSVGYKQPRWPECYPPGWTHDLSSDGLQSRILRVIEAEIVHTRSYSAVSMWQVENEPYVTFGNCAPGVLSPALLKREIERIHQLDTRRIVVTDSGEWSTLLPAVSTAGVDLGLSIYRDVPMGNLGIVHYPLPAWSYRFKDWLARRIAGSSGTTFISELQCEPWFEAGGIRDVPFDVQVREFPPERIVLANVEYARDTRLSRAYLWGVEWWYWMAAHGRPEYVQSAQRVFATSHLPAGMSEQ